MKKKVAAVVALLLIALITGGFFVQSRTVDKTRITLYGNVDVRQVFLAFDNSDRILEMRAEEGDRVKAGEILARQDTQTLTLQIAQAEA